MDSTEAMNTDSPVVLPSPGSPGFSLKFSQLNLTQRTFRLLHLLPLSQRDRTLQGHLEIYNLSSPDEYVPSYEAVSYAWLTNERTETIMVDGAELPVTTTLFTMLHRLSPTSADQGARVLWIDAVCIDQFNPHEQSHQVGMMGTIYSNAARVVFYLGDPTADTNLLMTALNLMEQRIDEFGKHNVDEHSREMIWSAVQAKMRENYSVVKEREKVALHDLLARPWFKRVWIIHEVGNAKGATVQVGGKSVGCETFVMTPDLLGMEVEKHKQDILDAMPTPKRETSWLSQGKTEERDLYRLLCKFGRADATVPRDRIYALLGLCDTSTNKTTPRSASPVSSTWTMMDGEDVPGMATKSGMVVDYNKSDIEVICDTIGYICSCDSKLLPRNLHSDIPSFFDNLYSLHSRVFSFLVQSGDLDGLASMLATRSTTLKITQSIFMDAVKNWRCGGQVVSLLLSSTHSSGLLVTEDVLVAAAQNKGQGLAVMQALFEPRLAEIRLTAPVASAIWLHSDQRPELVALFEQKLSARVGITEEIWLQAAGTTATWRTMLPFLESHDLSIDTLTKILLVAAQRDYQGQIVFQSLFDSIRHSGETRVTERILLTAVRNKHNATAILKTIFENRTPEVSPVPDYVLAALMQHRTQAFALLDLISLHQGVESITSAISNPMDPGTFSFLSQTFREWSYDLTIAKPRGESREPPAKLVRNEGQPILSWAISREHHDLLTLLLDKGTPVSNVDHPTEGPPILIAAGKNNAPMLQTLLMRGADIEPQIRDRFHSPIYIAIRDGCVPMLDVLTTHGKIKLNRNSFYGKKLNVMDLAVSRGNVETVRALLERGADVHQRTWNDRTALHTAAEMGNLEICQILLDHGADIDAAPSHVPAETPLMAAVRKQNTRLAQLLCENGANVHVRKATNGTTMLHGAAECGEWTIVRLLLDAGADIFAKCTRGKTPREWAVEYRNKEDEMVAMLAACEAQIVRMQSMEE